MKDQKVVLIDYGAGNIQSILFALNRLGVEGKLSAEPDEILSASHVIFPGVGEAGSAMKKLKEKGLDQLIPTLRQPVLGICLGMQLMCASSEEGNTPGLGIFDTRVIRFSGAVKVPQVGWNQISGLRSPLFNGISEGAYMYMVHSYYAPDCIHTIAETTYETTYASALGRDHFYGVQFHPEKSGEAGERLLHNFLNLEVPL